MTINSLTYRYSGIRKNVFDQLNLNIEEGGIYGLLGKNGVGKTTLLYLMCNLLKPKNGHIMVDGIDIQKKSAAMFENLFLVPEEFELPNCSLKQYINIMKPFYPKFSQECLKKYLKGFELPDNLHLGRISMGQKKKVYICFALATQCKYIIMDEPTNGLDIPSKKLFRSIIASSMDETRTLIISTHQVHDVEMLLDHVIILHDSKLILNESVAKIAEKYAFSYYPTGSLSQDVIYSEDSLQGQQIISRRNADNDDENETVVNLELLFNAAIKGKL